MHWDMRALGPGDRYKIIGSCIVPRPIAWISSLSADGVPNLAPFSFFNAMGNDPPILAIGMVKSATASLKDTAANIRDTGDFVVNLVKAEHAALMNATSADLPPDIEEAALAGIQMEDSLCISPQRVADAPVAFECRTVHYIETGPSQVTVLAEVLMSHVQDHLVTDADRIHFDIEAMDMIARMHGAGWYSRQTNLFEMLRPK
jgi:flavin reductase (DIM6/NTAB) family NADH-FMN oxidoreductase RutF